jgi:hypothetical protein
MKARRDRRKGGLFFFHCREQRTSQITPNRNRKSVHFVAVHISANESGVLLPRIEMSGFGAKRK